MIITLLNKPFPYLDSRRYRLIHVGIIMTYSVFFMVALNPYGFNSSFNSFSTFFNLGVITIEQYG